MKLDLERFKRKSDQSENDKPKLENDKSKSDKPKADKSKIDKPKLKAEKQEIKFDLERFKRNKDKQESIPLGEAIFVDLTPPSHKKLVEVRNLKKQWRYGLMGVAVFCVAASFVAVGLNTAAEGSLAAEGDAQLVITQNTATYAKVNSALELQKVAVDSLNLAAGSEINWNKLISSIEKNLPSGTQISAISVTSGGEKPKAKGDPNIAAVINLNLSSGTTIGYSDSLKKIEGITGISSVEISGLKSEKERYNYTLSFTYDTSLLTDRFTLKDTK